MHRTIKERLDEGEFVRVMCLSGFASPKLIEMAGIFGDLHGVWIDQEHSAIPHQQLELMLIACRAAGLDAFARVAPTDYATIMRPFEAGANGVMLAQIRTADQVLQAVEWAKYPPRGTRGLFLGNYEAGYGSSDARKHIEEANGLRWISVQIETAEAVECVDRIAALDGVDSLFVGPADLACTLGVPGQPMHPKCISALERVSSAARAAGKPWGALSRNPEHAAKYRDLGCQLFSLVSDVDLIHRGFKQTKELFPSFY